MILRISSWKRKYKGIHIIWKIHRKRFHRKQEKWKIQKRNYHFQADIPKHLHYFHKFNNAENVQKIKYNAKHNLSMNICTQPKNKLELLPMKPSFKLQTFFQYKTHIFFKMIFRNLKINLCKISFIRIIILCKQNFQSEKHNAYKEVYRGKIFFQ